MAIKNASPADVVQVTKDMNAFKEMYKNPLMVVLLTYAEILPLGLIFSLLSAILIKKK
jgi:pheromone shutdown protein TraB